VPFFGTINFEKTAESYFIWDFHLVEPAAMWVKLTHFSLDEHSINRQITNFLPSLRSNSFTYRKSRDLRISSVSNATILRNLE
jgi:hypothetical protein